MGQHFSALLIISVTLSITFVYFSLCSLLSTWNLCSIFLLFIIPSPYLYSIKSSSALVLFRLSSFRISPWYTSTSTFRLQPLLQSCIFSRNLFIHIRLTFFSLSEKLKSNRQCLRLVGDQMNQPKYIFNRYKIDADCHGNHNCVLQKILDKDVSKLLPSAVLVFNPLPIISVPSPRWILPARCIWCHAQEVPEGTYSG